MVQHIIDGEKFYSIYAHLDSYDVKPGMKVDNDTKIGEMGGSTSGGNIDPHLHFEVRKSVNVDITASDPFNNQVWWPESKDELIDNFVDLAAADFIDYADDFSNWP
jgi:murein DD-endopeptidase MepM/ murein hydrolase activator NlpD